MNIPPIPTLGERDIMECCDTCGENDCRRNEAWTAGELMRELAAEEDADDDDEVIPPSDRSPSSSSSSSLVPEETSELSPSSVGTKEPEEEGRVSALSLCGGIMWFWVGLLVSGTGMLLPRA